MEGLGAAGSHPRCMAPRTFAFPWEFDYAGVYMEDLSSDSSFQDNFEKKKRRLGVKGKLLPGGLQFTWHNWNGRAWR